MRRRSLEPSSHTIYVREWRRRAAALDVPHERCPIYSRVKSESLLCYSPQSSWPAFAEWFQKFGAAGVYIQRRSSRALT